MRTDLIDPWSARSASESNGNDTEDVYNGKSLSFEDDFVGTTSCDDEHNDSNNPRLPDSAEYIASLERKLEKIRSGKKQKKVDLAQPLENENKSSMLRSLEETHNSYMTRLVSSNSDHVHGDEEFILDTPVNGSTIMNYVQPEKQALTLGELVELVKYDQLAQALEVEEETPSE